MKLLLVILVLFAITFFGGTDAKGGSKSSSSSKSSGSSSKSSSSSSKSSYPNNKGGWSSGTSSSSSTSSKGGWFSKSSSTSKSSSSSKSSYPNNKGSWSSGTSSSSSIKSGSSYPSNKGTWSSGSSYPKSKGTWSSGSSYPTNKGGYYGGHSYPINQGSWQNHYGKKPKSSSSKLEKVATAIVINRAIHKARGSRYSYYGRRQHWHHRRPKGIIGIGRYHDHDEEDDYFYYNERTQSYDPRPRITCYTCDGQESENCGANPSNTIQQECERGYYCGVTRTEYLITYVPPPTPPPSSYDVGECKTWRNAEPGTGAPESSRQVWLNMMKVHNCRLDQGPQYNPANTTRVKRECVAPSIVRNYAAKIEKAANTTRAFKEFTTFCDSDRCNVGDGRLRCYKCEGTGDNDPCVVRPANVSEIVTCGENEFCHIMRKVKMVNLTVENLNVTDSDWMDFNLTMSDWESDNMTISNSSTSDNQTSTVLQMSIVRGCKAYSTKEEDYEVDEGGEILSGIATMSCASDMCNSLDGHSFSQLIVDPNSVTRLTFSLTTLFSLAILLAVLQ